MVLAVGVELRRGWRVLRSLALAAPAAALLAPATASGQALPEVSAYPSPGVVTASRATGFSFRGVPASALGTIRVSGSRSGRHSGVLHPHPDGQGASFIPRRPFTPGESVLVQTNLHIVDGHDGDFRIRIGNAPTKSRPPGSSPIPMETVAPGKRSYFQTRTDLRPPVVTIQKRSPAADKGLVFIGPKARQAGARQAGPMIIDDSGEPIWFRALQGRVQAFDVRVQQYQGKPVITWWQGTASQGMGKGEGRIFDSHYRLVKRVRAGNGYRSDLHEFLITPHDTAVITIYHPVRRDLRSVGGPDHGIQVDSIVQEVDIATGLVLFEWHSIGNVTARESYSPAPSNPNVPWDYFHVNSADMDANGDFLISGRSAWTVYKVERHSGHIAWRLGGKRSTFKRGPGASFAWQHDARFRDGGHLSIFDNSAAPPVRKRSRAIEIALDTSARTATLVRVDTHANTLAATQGDVQFLAGDHRFVGWGSQSAFTEFGADGGILFDGRVAIGYDTYRAYRQAWTGTPLSKPRIRARARKGGTTAIFASWNGATGVARWEVLAGVSATALSPVTTTPRGGFETALRVSAPGPYFAVRALDASGAELATSAPIRRH